jgi:hypothetical protein
VGLGVLVGVMGGRERCPWVFCPTKEMLLGGAEFEDVWASSRGKLLTCSLLTAVKTGAALLLLLLLSLERYAGDFSIPALGFFL